MRVKDAVVELSDFDVFELLVNDDSEVEKRITWLLDSMRAHRVEFPEKWYLPRLQRFAAEVAVRMLTDFLDIEMTTPESEFDHWYTIVLSIRMFQSYADSKGGNWR